MSADSYRLSKRERVSLIMARLNEAPPVASRTEALKLLDQIFRSIEDEHSGVPHDPYHTDRLYPPTAAMARSVEGKPWLKRYRHTSHYTLIADNGAIEIRVFARGIRDGLHSIIGERTEIDKPGADQRRISDHGS